MNQVRLSSVSDIDMSPHDAINELLADSKLEPFSRQPGQSDPAIAGIESNEVAAAENFAQFNERLNALCEKFARGFDDLLQAEDESGEGPPENVARDLADHIAASPSVSDDAREGAPEGSADTAFWSTASTTGDRPLAPVIAHLEDSLATLADQIAAQETAQEDLRKFMHSGFDGLAHRIDVAKRASEAAAQRAQTQAIRLAQEEMRKIAQSEFGRFAQRADATRQASEAAARRAQDQAGRLVQEELRKLVLGEFGRLGQRMDALKQASEAAAQRAQEQAVRLAQEEMRKHVQSELGRLGQRMDALKQAAEAKAQRVQDQAVRLAQEEVRKLVQGELGQFAQRMDALHQASLAAAERARNQAVQQGQKDLADVEGRLQALMRKEHGEGQKTGEMGRLRDEVESLGQRVVDLTVKAASEDEVDSLRLALERLSARVAQGPDLKLLSDFDRRLCEMTNKLEQRLTSHGGQMGAADLDKRIAAAMRQNQISPPWNAVERKLAAISDRLANTETGLQHIATHETWILQLYRNLEEILDWSRNVAEDAANRMAHRLEQDWTRKTNPASTSLASDASSDRSASPAATFSSRTFERSASSRLSLSRSWAAEPGTIAGALPSPTARAR
jgi:hypothetical protein